MWLSFSAVSVFDTKYTVCPRVSGIFAGVEQSPDRRMRSFNSRRFMRKEQQESSTAQQSDPCIPPCVYRDVGVRLRRESQQPSSDLSDGTVMTEVTPCGKISGQLHMTL